MTSRERAKARRNLATAHHEAGHAVIARYFGVGVKSVELTPNDPDQLGICRLYKPRRHPRDLDDDQLLKFVQNDLCISFAGQLAEARFLGRMPNRFRRQADMIDALHLACRVCRYDTEANYFYLWLFERTKEHVRFAWPTIQHVAEALFQTGRLSGSELLAVMRASLARPVSR